jgi:hypothetical protein
LAERKAASGNFEPMRRQVEAWQKSELPDVAAKVVIYEAFVEGKWEAAKHLAQTGERTVLRTEVRRIQAAKRSGVSLTRSPHLVFFFSSTDGTIHL